MASEVVRFELTIVKTVRLGLVVKDSTMPIELVVSKAVRSKLVQATKLKRYEVQV